MLHLILVVGVYVCLWVSIRANLFLAKFKSSDPVKHFKKNFCWAFNSYFKWLMCSIPFLLLRRNCLSNLYICWKHLDIIHLIIIFFFFFYKQLFHFSLRQQITTALHHSNCNMALPGFLFNCFQGSTDPFIIVDFSWIAFFVGSSWKKCY